MQRRRCYNAIGYHKSVNGIKRSRNHRLSDGITATRSDTARVGKQRRSQRNSGFKFLSISLRTCLNFDRFKGIIGSIGSDDYHHVVLRQTTDAW
jgi:hypothetical protein